MMEALGALCLGPAVMFGAGKNRIDVTRSVLRWMVARMPHPRTIYDRMGDSPYLTRHYLVYRDEGDQEERGKDAVRRGLFTSRHIGIYIHEFHRSDDDEDLHNHPFDWAIVVQFAGGYWEELRMPDDSVKRILRRPWSIRVLRAKDFHRVDLIEDDSWSLFIAGPKVGSWGFWDRHTGRYMPWRDFINMRRGNKEWKET